MSSIGFRRIQRNLPGSKISTSCTNFVFFGSIGKTRWPPGLWLAETFLLVPYRLAGGTLSLLAVCQSICPSVCHTSVFRTFLCRLLRYWLEIWYMKLSWHYTDQVRVWSRSTDFYRSYCPLLKSSSPDFSLSSFEISTWNLVYEFVMT